MLTPGNGLPDILKYRYPNRGFESVAVAPNGKIFGILEGVIDLDDNSRKTSKFIRVVEIDLYHNISKMYLYPFEYDDYENSSVVKLGDMATLDNTNFLLVEQGPSKNGSFQNRIYKINLENATDVSNMKLDTGKELEHGNLDDLKHIKFATKKMIFDPRQYGWTDQKLEGLTLVDPYTIAITNDTDFGIDDYEILEKADGSKKVIPIINEEAKLTNLWLIKFSEKI